MLEISDSKLGVRIPLGEFLSKLAANLRWWHFLSPRGLERVMTDYAASCLQPSIDQTIRDRATARTKHQHLSSLDSLKTVRDL